MRCIEFNSSDDYHLHAFYALSFSCETCSAQLGTGEEPAAEIAETAKSAGWYVPATEEIEQSHHFPAWCPTCSVRLGLSRLEMRNEGT